MLTSEIVGNIQSFVQFARDLEGDEKGEAQIFSERHFEAFGHEGLPEAGATLEYRVPVDCVRAG